MPLAYNVETANFIVSISYDVSPHPQLSWTSAVISGGSWLSITSGSGTNEGTITCNFTANASTSPRTATIRVTVTGSIGSQSQVDVQVEQAPTEPTKCVATLDRVEVEGKPPIYKLSIYYASYLHPEWGSASFSLALVYEYNPAYPALILFKLEKEPEPLTSGSFSCKASKIEAQQLLSIEIPDIVIYGIPYEGVVKLRYEPDISPKDTNTFWFQVIEPKK